MTARQAPAAQAARPAADDMQSVDFDVLPPGTATGSNELSRLIAWILDDLVRIPGTNLRVGLDPIVGLIPGLGDCSTSVFSSLILLQGLKKGVPRIVLVRMALNILVNSLLGVAPGIGDAFSAWFKSNARNYTLLEKHARTDRASTRTDWIFVIALLGGVLAIGIGASLFVTFAIIRLFTGS